jgi:hypothetical protein
VKLEVPRGIGRKSGVLEILGGNSYVSGGGELGDPTSLAPHQPASFDALLGRLRRAPSNDQVLAHLMLFRANGSTLERMGRTRATAVVDGGVTVEVQGVPVRRR